MTSKLKAGLLLALALGPLLAFGVPPCTTWDSRTCYEILGIANQASAPEIQRAFRLLAKRYHPDLNPGDESSENEFKLIALAWGTLGDEKEKALYDAGLTLNSGNFTRQSSELIKNLRKLAVFMVVRANTTSNSQYRVSTKGVENVADEIRKTYATSPDEVMEVVVDSMMIDRFGDLLVRWAARYWLRDCGTEGKAKFDSLQAMLQGKQQELRAWFRPNRSRYSAEGQQVSQDLTQVGWLLVHLGTVYNETFPPPSLFSRIKAACQSYVQ